MPFLFALPDALQHDDIPPDAKADILEIVQDLHRYIGAHHDALFAARFQPPRELYVGGEDDLSSAQLFLESKIASSPDQPQREPEGQNDLSGVPPHWLPTRDQSGVTDFIYTVFEQVVPCRVTNDDVKRKGRRFPVGFPGVCCRHCLGQFNEGRYFFSTQESLGKLSLAGRLCECVCVMPFSNVHFHILYGYCVCLRHAFPIHLSLLIDIVHRHSIVLHWAGEALFSLSIGVRRNQAKGRLGSVPARAGASNHEVGGATKLFQAPVGWFAGWWNVDDSTRRLPLGRFDDNDNRSRRWVGAAAGRRRQVHSIDECLCGSSVGTGLSTPEQ